MRRSARRSHQSVLQHYPQLLRNVCIGARTAAQRGAARDALHAGFAVMWIMLSATTFEEKPAAPSIFADE